MIAQSSYVICIIPVILFSIPKGFEFLCTARTVVSVELVIACLLIAWIYIKLSVIQLLKGISIPLLGIAMILLTYSLIPHYSEIYLQIISLSICAIVYLITLFCFQQTRMSLYKLKSLIIK